MKHTALRNTGIASVAGMAVFAGCSSEQKAYETWMETPGTANRINLEAVQKALEKSESIADFEKSVNEIYEGPHLVLIEVKDEGNGKKRISGYEDINGDKILNPQTDFLLFSSSVGDGVYDLRGSGVHNYYHHTGHFGGGGSLMLGYILGSMMSRPYYTPVARGTELNTYRNQYRASPKYTAQQRQNMAFRKAQVAKNPSASKGFRSRVSSSSSAYKASRRSGFRSGS
jgi:hypothetical protein